TKYMIHRSCQQNRPANQIFTQVLYLWLFLGILLVLTGLFFSDNIVILLGADEQTFSMSLIYLKILLICSPLFMLNQILLYFVRNDNAPELAMKAMLIGSFSNILLDYIFIYLLDMGMFGAVLATCCSPVISMLELSSFFLEDRNNFRPVNIKPNLKQCSYILSIGAASFVTELSSGIVIIIFNLLMLKLAGNTGVASYGIIANISLVVTSVWTGVAQGVQPLLSEAYARKKSLLLFFKSACFVVIGLFIFIYGGIFLFANQIAEIFNQEQDILLQNYAVQGLQYYFLGAVFAGMNILIAILFAVIEKPFQSNSISLLRGFILIIPCAFLLANLFHMKGLWLAYPVTECLTFLVSIYFLTKNNLKKNSSYEI
ncbi:MAG: polysaccharide biosynthesis C-terminal domain-containing protein, partial [Oscillospiraceae bacterium]|nr:polysaccharide biosynthesis C-terminal domain-containing protein [Oscillospiraceae bacterium]